MIRYRYLMRKVVLTILLLVATNAAAALPEFNFVYSVSENSIDASNQIVKGQAIAISGGGDVLSTTVNGSPAVLIASFGQSFAGTALSTSASPDLMALADSQYSTGARFLAEDDIIKRGLVDPAGLETLTGNAGGLNGVPTYNESDLIEAEVNYRRAILINPLNASAVEGAVQARRARVLKGNFVWDFKQKQLFVTRYTDSQDLNPRDTAGRVLSAELTGYDEISQIQRSSILLLLELYADPLFRGPGALLRGEISIPGSDVVTHTHRLVFSTGLRFAKSELFWGEKSLLLSFFNQGLKFIPGSRASIINRLQDSHGYVTNVLQLISPYVDSELLETSDLPGISSFQGRLDELMRLTNQGYNPFGFLPDFVPFLKSGAHNKNLFTYEQLRDIAINAIGDADEKQVEVVNLLDEIQQFSTTANEYALRMEELEISYESRLKTLVGVAFRNNQEEPDIHTALYPDRDLDGDGVSERDQARLDIEADSGITFGAKGQVAEQYQIIEIAETRAEQAFNETSNIVRRIELKEQEAREVSEVLESEAESIFLLIKENSDQVGLLTRQRAKMVADAQNWEARQAQDNALFGGFVGLIGGAAAASVSGNPSGLFSAFGQITGALNMNTTPGRVTEAVGKIDAQISEIQAMERAEIQMTQMEAAKKQLLIKTKFIVAELALQQANLGLDFYIAQRDIDREINRLGNIYGEVNTLLADYIRIKTLLEKNIDNLEIGWADEDVRDILSNSVLIADNALKRAKVWSFVALRALEYYANQPPQANGQPGAQILSLYKRLYVARRTEDLADLIDEMNTKAQSEFVFTLGGTSCPSRGLLSLKYDVLAPTIVSFAGDGTPTTNGVINGGSFSYRDPATGVVYNGNLAYQAMFKDALREAYIVDGNRKSLRLRFATNLFPPRTDGNDSASNPFYLKSATNSKVLGFTNPNCSGVGVPVNAQGIQINMTGNINISSIFISLSQLGNSYLKHTPWENQDFDENNRVIEPLKNMTVYSSYEQILPSWLISDIDPNFQPGDEERIGSNVTSVVKALRNGQGDAGKTLDFADRAVGNDMWELLIEDNEGGDNFIFFNLLETMLADPDPKPSTDLITDIQLWIGWNYRNPN